MARARLRVSGLGARHHPVSRYERPSQYDRERGDRFVRRHRAQHFYDWALGGLVFGPIADRYGRAKTMAIPILFMHSSSASAAAPGPGRNWLSTGS